METVFKVIGILAALSSGVFGGIFFAYGFKRRIEVIKDYISSLEFIRDSIRMNNTLIEDIFHEIPECSVKKVFENTLKNIDEGMSLDTGFIKSLEESPDSQYLKKEKKILGLFAGKLGKVMRDMQVTYMDQTISELREILNEAEVDYKKYYPMYMKLGLLAGIAFGIFII